MSKHPKTSGTPLKAVSKGWPLVIYVWVFGLGLAGYFIGRITIADQLHPLHWAAGLVGAVIGYVVGWLWYRWRGDI